MMRTAGTWAAMTATLAAVAVRASSTSAAGTTFWNMVQRPRNVLPRASVPDGETLRDPAKLAREDRDVRRISGGRSRRGSSALHGFGLPVLRRLRPCSARVASSITSSSPDWISPDRASAGTPRTTRGCRE